MAWWADWKAYGVLPFGGANLGEEPAHVLESFRVVDRVASKIAEEAAAAGK